MRADGRLAQHGIPELLPKYKLGNQADHGASLCRPAIGQLVQLRPVAIEPARGRLGDDQPAADLEKRCGALGRYRRSGEASSHDDGESFAISLVPAGLLGTGGENLYPGREIELGDRPTQKVGGTASGVEKDKMKLRIPNGEHEAGQPSAGAEI